MIDHFPHMVRTASLAIFKNLLISACILAPGLVLMLRGRPTAGMIVLMLGSFSLMAASYSKPWRLSFWSCLIPPATGALCYVAQLYLFRHSLPPAWAIGAAAGGGVLVGILRGIVHKVYDEDGAIMAKRSIFYLLVWFLAIGCTQGFAQFGAKILFVRGGLLTGAFSTAMLLVVSLFLLVRFGLSRRRLHLAAPASAALLIVTILGFATESARAASIDEARIKSEFARLINLSQYQYRGYQLEVPSSPDGGYPDATANFEFGKYFKNSGERGFAAQGQIFLAVSVWVFDDPAACQAKAREMYKREMGFREGSSGTASPIDINPGIGEFSAGLLYPYRSGGSGSRHEDHAFATAASGQIAVFARVLARDAQSHFDETWAPTVPVRIVSTLMPALIQAQATLSPTPGPNPYGDPNPDRNEGLPMEDTLGGSGSGRDGSSSGNDAIDEWLTSTGGWAFPDDPIARTVLVIAGLMTMAGIGSSVAQALATALQEALQRAAAEAGSPPSAPVLDPDGNPLDRDDDGRFLAPDENGDWVHMDRQQAEAAMDAIRAENAARASEQVEHDRATAEMTGKWQEDWERRAAAERAGRHAELDQEARNRQNIDSEGRIVEIAARNADWDILSRATDPGRMYDENGNLDVDYLNRIKDTLRDRLGREIAAPSASLEEPPGGWVGDFASNTAYDAIKNPLIRMGVGVLSSGSSEVVYQTWTAGEGMKEAAEQAVDRGEEMGTLDGLRSGFGTLVRENLPTETARTIAELREAERTGKEGPGWWQIGTSVVSDVMISVGLKDDAKNVLGGITRGDIHYRGGNTSLDEAIAPTRLTPAEAKAAAESGKLSSRARGALDEAQSSMGTEKGAGIRELDEAFQGGREAGRQRVQNLDEAVRDLDELKAGGRSSPEQIAAAERRVREDVLRVQGDKHAMNELNKLPRADGGTNRTIEAFNRDLEGIYHESDIGTRARIAEEYGVPIEDVELVKITNQPGKADATINPRAPDRVEPGLASAHAEGGKVERINGEPSAAQRSAFTEQNAEGLDGLRRRAREAAEAQGAAHGKKASFDRDMTMRVRIDGVLRDVPSNVTGRIYNEEFFGAAKGLDPGSVPKSRGEGFINTHLSADNHLRDIMEIDDVDAFASRLDQATTDRLNAEAYGTGQPDLDTATKDPFRGRDLIDAEGTAATIGFKQNHWLNESDRLREFAEDYGKQSRNLRAEADSLRATDPGGADLKARQADLIEQQRRRLLEASTSHHEEGMRQLVKQNDNMLNTRTGMMVDAHNAPNASIPIELVDKVNVLRQVQRGEISAPVAEATLRAMGTSTRTVSSQLSALVEGTQTLRPPGHVPIAPPKGQFDNLGPPRGFAGRDDGEGGES